MIKKMLFLRGLPGSGKSRIAGEYRDKHHDSCFICSTDQYWMRPDGKYDFNASLLGEAHRWNQQCVRDTLMDEIGNPQYDTVIIVDNTNITFKEMKPYISMALEYDYDIEFIEPKTDWKYDVEACCKRNTHHVPRDTIFKMSCRWEDRATVTRKLKELTED